MSSCCVHSFFFHFADDSHVHSLLVYVCFFFLFLRLFFSFLIIFRVVVCVLCFFVRSMKTDHVAERRSRCCVLFIYFFASFVNHMTKRVLICDSLDLQVQRFLFNPSNHRLVSFWIVFKRKYLYDVTMASIDGIWTRNQLFMRPICAAFRSKNETHTTNR